MERERTEMEQKRQIIYGDGNMTKGKRGRDINPEVEATVNRAGGGYVKLKRRGECALRQLIRC